MTEEEYIIMENLQSFSIVRSILRKMIEDGIVSKDELGELNDKVRNISDRYYEANLIDN